MAVHHVALQTDNWVSVLLYLVYIDLLYIARPGFQDGEFMDWEEACEQGLLVIGRCY